MEQKLIDLFWSKIEKREPHWIWTGYVKYNSGTPLIQMGNPQKEYYPRRISLELHGVELPQGKKVRVICGNKLCVNPAHLCVGDEARFWTKVNKTDGNGCWLWTAGISPDGYGKFTYRIDGTTYTVRSHRYIYELLHGPIPEGLVVMHICDTPLCVRPDHLKLGTVIENVHDRDQKNRSMYGEAHRDAKLTEEQVKEARELFATMTVKQLSGLYGVSESAIHSAIIGKTWKRVH